MTSRERVKKAVAGEEADRYPIDLGMHFSTGVSVFAYRDLREYLGFSTDNVQLADTVQMLARVDDDVRERFHIDTTLLVPPYRNLKKWKVRGKYVFNVPRQMDWEQTPDGGFIFKRGEERMRLPAGGYFADGNWIQIWDECGEELLKYFGKEAARLSYESDKFFCLMGIFTGFFTGIEMACDMLTDPDSVHAFNKNLLANQKRSLDIYIGAGGKRTDCIEINSDLGMQCAPMLSAGCYEEFVFPYMKEFISYIHDKTDAKVFLHCCGSVEPLIPLLIGAGVEILNPVQISAANMDPAALKKKYGGKICFWGGGCDTQTVLGAASPGKVRENVRELTNIFKKGGGFVFNQVHNIMGNVPPQNIAAMLDEAYANSGYKKI